ncbi:MAG: hypothetical protein DRR42_12160 [Gammaproteobacteria bacterium]|nr:MAG: hypothetical protein DRR42_12160 [Gammaproteobacteria bacterium]
MKAADRIFDVTNNSFHRALGSGFTMLNTEQQLWASFREDRMAEMRDFIQPEKRLFEELSIQGLAESYSIGNQLKTAIKEHNTRITALPNLVDLAGPSAFADMDKLTDRSFQQLQASMHWITESPTMMALSEAANSPVSRLVDQIRDIEPLQSFRHAHAAATRSIDEALAQSPLRDALAGVDELIAVRATDALYSSTAFMGLVDYVDTHTEGMDWDNLIGMRDVFRDEDDWYAEGGPEEVSESFLARLEQWIATAHVSPLVARVLLEIFVGVIVALCMQAVIGSRDAKRLDQIEQQFTQSAGKLDQLGKLAERVESMLEEQSEAFRTEAPSLLLVSAEGLRLREGPSTDRRIRLVMRSGAYVRELSRADDWVEIEYFEPVGKTVKHGWAHAHYLISTDGVDSIDSQAPE